jgi:putative ABC transport system permease protein
MRPEHWLYTIPLRLRSLFRRAQADQELGDELRYHLEQKTKEFVAAGLTIEEARSKARREFGGLEQAKENCRDTRGVNLIEEVLQDLRFGARGLRKNPGFAAVALLTLALGIGANAVIFSIVNSVLLRPLAYRQPQQLYLIREIIPQMSNVYPSFPANLRNFRTWQREAHLFEQFSIVEPLHMALTTSSDTEEVFGGLASANLFDVLGVEPIIGRSFLPGENAPGRDRVVVLTDSMWRNRFHSDASLLGRFITLDGQSYEVVGVLPASFRFPKDGQLGVLTDFGSRTEFFKPLGLDPEQFSELGEFDFAAIARLKPGANADRALAELNVIQARIAKEANQGVDLSAQLIPLENALVGPARRGLLLLLGGVGAVLLIVCVNLANLLLARVPGRLREAAIRVALGASRARLTRQLLTESSLLALCGGLLGIAAAYVGFHWLVNLAPVDLPRLDEVRMDARVLSFALSLTVLTGIFFGSVPAWRVVHAEPQQTLKSGATTTTESPRTRRLRELLIGFEVGTCTLLLIVAGLLTMSMIRLLGVDKGFVAEHALAIDVSLPPQNYAKPASKEQFYERVEARVRSLPGVNSVGWISKLPLEGEEQVDVINVPGRQTTQLQAPLANYRYVSSGYFRAAGIPLRQGRWFEEADRTHHVAVISESVSVNVWPGENPIGKKFQPGDPSEPLLEVIGVVGDIRAVALDHAPLLMVYLPNGPSSPNWSGSHASLVVRAAMPLSALSEAVRSAVREVDSTVPILQIQAMSEIVLQSVGVRRFQMFLACLFASFTLLLAALGIFGVVAYSVEQRRQELGIRKALGAQASDLRRLVLRQGMTPVVLGAALGVVTALSINRLIQGLLYGVTARDPLTIAGVVLVVLLTGILACYVPAARSTKLDPMVALRNE